MAKKIINNISGVLGDGVVLSASATQSRLEISGGLDSLKLPSLSSDPVVIGGALAGDIYFNSVDGALKYYDGSSWDRLRSASELSASSGTTGSSLIGYDPTASGQGLLSGTNLQAAIEELEQILGPIANDFTQVQIDITALQDFDTAYTTDINTATANANNYTVGGDGSIGDHLDGIDDALGTLQSDISGHLDGGANKHDASEIDVESAGNFTTISDLATNLSALDSAFGGNLSFVPVNYADPADTVQGHLQGIDSQLGILDSLISGFEWQNSALDYVVDNTLVPASEVLGDRYILSHDGGVPNAAYDGATPGSIVEFDGSVWVETVPTIGTFISADDEPTVLYCWGGASWSSKAFESTTASTGLVKSGFDIRLADAVVSNGISVSSGAISLELAAADSGLQFVSNQLSLDINGLTSEIAVVPVSDFLVMYDASASAHRRLGIDDLQAAIDTQNTLDQAYDQGGAGAGRTILAENGAVQIDTNTASNNALELITSAGSGIALSVSSGSNDGISVFGSGRGIDVSMTAGTGDAISVSHLGTGIGIDVSATGALVAAIRANGGSNTGFVSDGSGIAFEAFNVSNTTYGIRIQQASSGSGIQASSTGGSDFEASGNNIGFDYTGSGTALSAQSVTSGDAIDVSTSGAAVRGMNLVGFGYTGADGVATISNNASGFALHVSNSSSAAAYFQGGPGSEGIEIKQSSPGAKVLRLTESDVSGDSISISLPPLAASYTLQLPDNDGDAGQVMISDGTGILSWSDVSDELIKVSANDANAGYLFDKLVAVGGSGIQVTEFNDGADEDLALSLDFNGMTAEPGIVSTDFMAFYDVTAGQHRKILVSDLQSAIGLEVFEIGAALGNDAVWDAGSTPHGLSGLPRHAMLYREVSGAPAGTYEVIDFSSYVIFDATNIIIDAASAALFDGDAALNFRLVVSY